MEAVSTLRGCEKTLQIPFDLSRVFLVGVSSQSLNRIQKDFDVGSPRIDDLTRKYCTPMTGKKLQAKPTINRLSVLAPAIIF